MNINFSEIQKAIFLDRDGTILKEIQTDTSGETGEFGYLTKIEDVELIQGAADGIALARELGYLVIIITNQSAIARGMITIDELQEIHNRMFELLLEANQNAKVDDLFYSPFHQDGIIEEYKTTSELRKPDIGMITAAQKKYNIDLLTSYIIGDSFSDMLCGQNAGVKKILVETGYGKIAYRKCLDENIKIDFIASNLLGAVKFIQRNVQ